MNEPRSDTHTALDPATVAELREQLVARLEEERAHLAEQRATVEELTGQGDVDSQLERELAEEAVTRAEKSLVDIEDAVRRIDDGTFGTCERCGQPIAPARLEAIPETRTCVNC